MSFALPTRQAVDRARHRAGHQALAAVFALGTRLWHLRLNPGYPAPPPGLVTAVQRRFLALLERDLANAEAGYYPRALALRLPLRALAQALPEALADMPRILRRKREAAYAEVPELANDARYPAYYRRNFHWQTDGWLSEHSARVYDFQTEFLFFGTMDVMRRMSMAELVRALPGGPRARETSPRLLDVGCGTGRLLQQLQSALPKAQLFGVDLSPHYVARAQQVCASVPGASLLVGNAEELPLADQTFDAVTCTFLFHELPHDARRRVVSELFRVTRPGGVCIVQDSMQRSDPNGAELAFFLDWFPSAYHEPYYKGYVGDPVAPMLTAAGFQVERTEHPLLSSIWVARKSG